MILGELSSLKFAKKKFILFSIIYSCEKNMNEYIKIIITRQDTLLI